MVWPIPAAKDIAAKFAASIETGLLAIRSDLDAVAVSRAVRSARGVFSQIGRAFSAELREVHDHQAWWGRQYMPDSADDEAMILRHASIWGVEPRGALKAVGSVTVEGTVGTALPAGIELASSLGLVYRTTEEATITPLGTITVKAQATSGGVASNLEAGVRLASVLALPDVSRITVAEPFSGGADEQSPAEIQAAYLERIRRPPHGGAGFDYARWVAEVASVKAVAVVPDWIGYGSLGLVIIMRNDDGSARAPTGTEIDTIQDYIGRPSSQTGVKPVTARVIVVPGDLLAIPLTLRLRPDTVRTRQAVTDAYARFIATIGDEDDTVNSSPIGATIEPSRISEAISAASSEYAHDLISPAAPIILDRTDYPVAGTINFEES